MHHPDYVKGKFDVGFMEQHLEEILAWDENGQLTEDKEAL
jgi:acetyl-CoA carboxylase biotin carboxylase subunit